jgi:hypothetical protein
MATHRPTEEGASGWSYQTTLAAEPVSASRARAFVTRHLSEHRLLHLVDPVRLTASELATNALVHARTRFTLTLEEQNDIVLLSVRDGSTELAVKPVHDSLDISGRGLRIVALLSLDWGVSVDTDGAKTVWVSFPRHQQPR